MASSSGTSSSLYDMFTETAEKMQSLAAPPSELRGLASCYTQPAGSETASGEPFNPGGDTAAMFGRPGFHRGDTVRVQLQDDPSRSVDVRVNDAGPFLMDQKGNAVTPLQPHPTRVIDLTPNAMGKLVETPCADSLVPVIVTKIGQSQS